MVYYAPRLTYMFFCCWNSAPSSMVQYGCYPPAHFGGQTSTVPGGFMLWWRTTSCEFLLMWEANRRGKFCWMQQNCDLTSVPWWTLKNQLAKIEMILSSLKFMVHGGFLSHRAGPPVHFSGFSMTPSRNWALAWRERPRRVPQSPWQGSKLENGKNPWENPFEKHKKNLKTRFFLNKPNLWFFQTIFARLNNVVICCMFLDFGTC